MSGAAANRQRILGADSASHGMKLPLDALVKRITACFMRVQSSYCLGCRVQLAWANELLEAHLAGASQELLQISSGTGADSASQDLKLHLDGLVKRITACFVGVQSCIPEPPSPATSRPTHGTPLTTPAQVSP